MIHNMPRPAIAYINLNHLQHNFRLLQQRAGRSTMMAVVKANAYGHGLDLIALALLDAGCRNFGVTEAEEGTRLRDILGDAKRNDAKIEPEITLLSGVFDRSDAALITKHALTPAITEASQIQLLQGENFHGQIWLKVDTGMNRLGAGNLANLIEQSGKAGIHVRGIMSHLACADTPDHPLNRQQIEALMNIRSSISSQMPASLLNSAGMITMPEHNMDVVRPGIALYGSEPVIDQPLGLKPVMQLTGAVMQIRHIPAGAQVSYGGVFTAGKSMCIAVIGMGYADGLPRALSNRGYAFFAGRKLAIAGRVCMDYTMLDVSNISIQPGDSVEFWGDNILANDVANMLDTISYTLFTGVNDRVRRIAEYGD